MNYGEEFKKYLQEKAKKSKINTYREIKNLNEIIDKSEKINKIFEEKEKEEDLEK